MALAAGLLSSHAQVYSANVVGYVNITAPGGFTQQSAPLKVSASGLNLATNVFGMDPNLDGVLSFLILDAANSKYFPEVYQNSGQISGTWYEDISGFSQPTPSLPVGLGFVVHNASTSFTNTVVGEVIGWNSATLTFSNGVVMPDGYSSRSSPLPIAVTLGAPGNNSLTNDPGKTINGLAVVQLVGGVNVTKYYDDGSPTGFSDLGGASNSPPVLPVGSSVLFINDGLTFYGHAGIPWNQTLP